MSSKANEASGAAKNTDREIWRRVPDDYYSPSIHVTDGNGIGLNVGGTVIVKPIEDWFKLAASQLSVATVAREPEQDKSAHADCCQCEKCYPLTPSVEPAAQSQPTAFVHSGYKCGCGGLITIRNGHWRCSLEVMNESLSEPAAQNQLGGTVGLDHGGTRRCCNNLDCNNDYPCSVHPEPAAEGRVDADRREFEVRLGFSGRVFIGGQYVDPWVEQSRKAWRAARSSGMGRDQSVEHLIRAAKAVLPWVEDEESAFDIKRGLQDAIERVRKEIGDGRESAELEQNKAGNASSGVTGKAPSLSNEPSSIKAGDALGVDAADIAREIKNLATNGWRNKGEELEYVFRQIIKRAEMLTRTPARGSEK